MTNQKALENKIKELEARIQALETDRDYMSALYNKAKEIITKTGPISIISLQKKLLIDFERAKKLMAMLHENVIL